MNERKIYFARVLYNRRSIVIIKIKHLKKNNKLFQDWEVYEISF